VADAARLPPPWACSVAGQVGHAQGDAATLIHRPDGRRGRHKGSTPGKPTDHAAGPDASGAAGHGLCRAWSAGQGQNGPAHDRLTGSGDVPTHPGPRGPL
jgi:hypothetical protein